MELPKPIHPSSRLGGRKIDLACNHRAAKPTIPLGAGDRFLAHGFALKNEGDWVDIARWLFWA